MKDTLLTPVVYLLVVILLGVLLVLSAFLYIAVELYNPASGVPWGAIPARLPLYLPLLLPVIVSSSVLLVSIRIDRKQRKGFIARVLLAAVSFITLILATNFIRPVSATPRNETADSPIIITQQISIFDSTIVYIEEKEGPRLQDVYIKQYRDTDGSFIHYPHAFITGNEIEDNRGNTVLSFSSSNPVFENLFRPQDTMSAFFEDIRIVSDRFFRASTEGGFFRLLVLGSFILFSLAIWTTRKLTRWPFINICLSVALFRGLFYLYRVTMNEDITDFISAAFSGNILDILPEVTLLAAAALMFLLSLLRTGKERP